MESLLNAAALICGAFVTLSPRAVPNTLGELSSLAARAVQRGLGCSGTKAFHRDSTVGFTELVPSQLQTISHVRTWKIIETRLVLTASGPHVNLALMWSLSLKGWWIEFLFGCQNCPFHYFLAVAVGTLGLWYYCYPGLLAAISSDNFTSISNFAPFTPHCYDQETGTRV